MKKYERIVTLLAEDDKEQIQSELLFEDYKDKIIRKLGDSTFFEYVMWFEEYLENHDIYLFDGWDDAQLLKPVTIQKFWAIFRLLLPKGTDLQGAKRLINNKEAQNSIKYVTLPDGRIVMQLKIVKKFLDEIKEKAEEEAKEFAKEEVSNP